MNDHKVSNIRRTKSQSLSDYRLVLQLSLPKSQVFVDNEDVVEVAPTGNAPVTSEWSTILLPSPMQLIFEVWRYAWLHIK